MATYTAFVSWDDDGQEEIDVQARDEQGARAQAQAELDRDYEPGGRIVAIVGPRFGLYL